MENNKRQRAQGDPTLKTATLRKASWKYLTIEQQSHLEELSQLRKASSILELPDKAKPADFFNAKAKELDLNCSAARIELQYFDKSMEEGKMTKEEYYESVNSLKETTNYEEGALCLIKRQKRHLIQDIEEMRPPPTIAADSKVHQSWLNLLIDKVATAGTMAKRKFDQGKFRDTMLDYYGVEKIGEDGSKYHYCVVMGEWIEEIKGKTQVKAAHIVPKALSGTDLDSLFNIGETMLQEARNSKFSSSFHITILIPRSEICRKYQTVAKIGKCKI